MSQQKSPQDKPDRHVDCFAGIERPRWGIYARTELPSPIYDYLFMTVETPDLGTVCLYRPDYGDDKHYWEQVPSQLGVVAGSPALNRPLRSLAEVEQHQQRRAAE